MDTTQKNERTQTNLVGIACKQTKSKIKHNKEHKKETKRESSSPLQHHGHHHLP